MFRAAALLLSLPLLAQSPSAPEPEPSTLALPIRVDLAPLLKQVEAQVPLSPPNVETWADVKGKPRTCFRYNLIREPLTVRVKDAQVTVRVAANYGLDVGLRTVGGRVAVMGSCGRTPEPPRRVHLELSTRIGVLPAWGLELRDTAFEVRPVNPCEITFLGYDLTDQVAAGMRDTLAGGAETLGRLVRESALARQKAQEAWALLSQPIELRRDLYLVFQPRLVRLAPLSTQGRTLLITPEIEVQPRLVLGERPAVQALPLPDLQVNAAPKPGFRLRVDADLSYAHASQQLAAGLVGRTFDTAKGRFEITSLAIRGNQGLAVLEVGLRGRIEGRVALTGRPVADPATGLLRLDDLDFTLESRSWLARMGDWIYHSDLKKLLAERARLVLDQQFQGLREAVQAGLNRQLAPNLRLSGALKEVRLESVALGPGGFQSRATLEGEVRMDIQ
jgi:hypothetical protein